MIRLNLDTFRRAIDKAQLVRPTCNLVDDDSGAYTFRVSRSDGGAACVDIWFTGGVLWSSCDFLAGTGHDGRRSPMPCYHVATAALSIGLLPAALPLGAIADPTPAAIAAAPAVPAPLLNPAELATPDPAPGAVIIAIPAPAPAPLMSDAIWARLGAYVRGFRLRGPRGIRGAWLARSSRA